MRSHAFFASLLAAMCFADSVPAQGVPTAATPTAAGDVQPPNFSSMFTFQSGYKNIVTLKTTEATRVFRMEGERCFVEGKFAVDDQLGGQSTSWLIPAVSFARAASDEKFCNSGSKIPVLLQKELRKSFFGASYRVGEFKWGGFAGTFEVK